MYNFHNLEPQKYWVFGANAKVDPKAEIKNMIFSGDYIGSRKMDGAFYKFWKDENGNMELLGRSKGVGGDYLNKIDWVPHLQPFFNKLPNGTCIIGEIYFPNNEGSHNVTTIMGCLKDKAISRQEKGEKLHYYVFDVLAWAGKSTYQLNIEDRLNYLDDVSYVKNEYVEIAQYYDGKKLWDELQVILASGGEGVVITKKGTCYQPGKRPARQTVKVKRELQETLDCFFTGHIASPTRLYSGTTLPSWQYWENIKTGEKLQGQLYINYMDGESIEPVTKPYFLGMAGSLEIGVLRDGKVCSLGWLSGLSDEIKSNYKDYKGKCLEVGAMQFTDDGALRHAKMIRLRPDLNIEDCTWEKIFH
jgi:ATP-dependent DNA ligase